MFEFEASSKGKQEAGQALEAVAMETVAEGLTTVYGQAVVTVRKSGRDTNATVVTVTVPTVDGPETTEAYMAPRTGSGYGNLPTGQAFTVAVSVGGRWVGPKAERQTLRTLDGVADMLTDMLAVAGDMTPEGTEKADPAHGVTWAGYRHGTDGGWGSLTDAPHAGGRVLATYRVG